VEKYRGIALERVVDQSRELFRDIRDFARMSMAGDTLDKERLARFMQLTLLKSAAGIEITSLGSGLVSDKREEANR
jgi:hypothetical protein